LEKEIKISPLIQDETTAIEEKEKEKEAPAVAQFEKRVTKAESRREKEH
jgi:hypothetical protein